MNITTNHCSYFLTEWHELPRLIQLDFDYVEGDDRFTPRFIRYKDVWYDTHDAQRIVIRRAGTDRMGWAFYVDQNDPLAKWDAIISETFFSGVLFKFVEDDRVICGRYY